MSITHTTIDSPIGELTLVAADGALGGVYFPGHWYMPDSEAFAALQRRALRAKETLRGRADAWAAQVFVSVWSNRGIPTVPRS